MRGWDPFHHGGKELVNMISPASVATGDQVLSFTRVFIGFNHNFPIYNLIKKNPLLN